MFRADTGVFWADTGEFWADPGVFRVDGGGESAQHLGDEEMRTPVMDLAG